MPPCMAGGSSYDIRGWQRISTNSHNFRHGIHPKDVRLTARIYSINSPNATAKLTITHCWLFHKPFHPVIPSPAPAPAPSPSCCGKKLLASSFAIASSEAARERLRIGIGTESRMPIRVQSVYAESHRQANRKIKAKEARSNYSIKVDAQSVANSGSSRLQPCAESPEREDAVGCQSTRQSTRYVSRRRGARAKTARSGNAFLVKQQYLLVDEVQKWTSWKKNRKRKRAAQSQKCRVENQERPPPCSLTSR